MDQRLVKIGAAAYRHYGWLAKEIRSHWRAGASSKGEQPSFEEELASDVLEIITVFSARLYGSRSKKHKTLLASLGESDEAAVATAKQLSMLG